MSLINLDASILGLFGLGYLLGSLPFSLWVSRLKDVDLRKQGSGNLGATNVYRVMGWKYALLVFLLDMTKGYIPTFLAISTQSNPWLHIAVGATVILGHSWTLFADFKGGKGAASGLGVLLALSPLVFVIVAVLAIGLIAVTRMVSVATISCCLLLPVLMWYFEYPSAYYVFMIGVSGFIIYRHKANIQRLLKGTENKL